MAHAMDAKCGGIDARIVAKSSSDKYCRGSGPRLGHQCACACRLAGIPRGRSRRALFGAQDLDELERSAAPATLEDQSRAGLVLVCRGGSHAIYPGAAWPEGGRGLL